MNDVLHNVSKWSECLVRVNGHEVSHVIMIKGKSLGEFEVASQL